MNVPNSITLARIFFIPIFVYLAEIRFFAPGWGLPSVFILLGLSDLFDGWYARKFKMVTAFGQLLDPIADKILTLAGLLVVADAPPPDYASTLSIPLWTVLVIMAREFAIGGFRSYAASQGMVVQASSAGKLKTTVTMVSISCLLGRSPEPFTGLPAYEIGFWLYWVALVLTWTSGIEYIYKNRSVFKEIK